MTYIVTCRHNVAHKDCPWPECQQILALTEQLAKAERLLNAQRKPKQSGMIKRVAKQEWVGLTDDEVYRIAFELEGEHWRKITDAIEALLKKKKGG